MGKSTVKEKRIFSGDYSRDMWADINAARTRTDLREALYFVCCRLQELEERMIKKKAKKRLKKIEEALL